MAAGGSLRPAFRTLAVCGALAAAAALFAYENDGRGRTVKGGPHRAINRLAVERFFDEKKADPVVSRYDLARSKKLLHETYVSGDMFRPGKGDRAATFTRWIEEGAYTADEPELYASFRHFYDPLALERGAGRAPLGAARRSDASRARGSGRRCPVPHRRPEQPEPRLLDGHGHHRQPADPCERVGDRRPGEQRVGREPLLLEEGIEYVENAFAATGPEKQRLWAKAWRSLGETMHLLGDMTSVPHVRNDSHPAASTYVGESSNDVGRLRSDPFETLAQRGPRRCIRQRRPALGSARRNSRRALRRRGRLYNASSFPPTPSRGRILSRAKR